jgi:zinc protease
VQGSSRVADSAGSSASVLGRGPALFMLTGVPAQGKTAADVEGPARPDQAVAKEGVQAAELERVKTQWMASNVYERDSVMGQAQNLGSTGPGHAAGRRGPGCAAAADGRSGAGRGARYFGDDQLTVGTLVPSSLWQAAEAPPCRPVSGDLH